MCFKIKHSYGINWKSWLSWMRGCERWGGNNTVSTCLWDVTHGSPCVGWPCLSLASTLDVCILALHHGLNAIGTIGPGILYIKDEVYNNASVWTCLQTRAHYSVMPMRQREVHMKVRCVYIQACFIPTLWRSVHAATVRSSVERRTQPRGI